MRSPSDIVLGQWLSFVIIRVALPWYDDFACSDVPASAWDHTRSVWSSLLAVDSLMWVCSALKVVLGWYNPDWGGLWLGGLWVFWL
ncbi:hypothetical protein U1Q18_049933, partial [Sarracenia purpurea var. burkii]